jgi:hypothetical protein
MKIERINEMDACQLIAKVRYLEAQVLARDSYIKSLEQYRTMDGERIKSLESKAEQAEKRAEELKAENAKFPELVDKSIIKDLTARLSHAESEVLNADERARVATSKLEEARELEKELRQNWQEDLCEAEVQNARLKMELLKEQEANICHDCSKTPIPERSSEGGDGVKRTH